MKNIKDYKVGEPIEEGIFLVKGLTNAKTKNGNPYLQFTLNDKSGSMLAKIWNPDEPGIEKPVDGNFIKIKANVDEYNGSTYATIYSCVIVQAADLDVKNYIPATKYDIDQLFGQLKEAVNTCVTDDVYKDVINDLVFNGDFMTERFKSRSAAKTVHHAFLGGLIEHTNAVVRNCLMLGPAYGCDMSLLVTAAILHDIGKVYEFSDFPENEMTPDGKLIGHVVMSAMLVYGNRLQHYDQTAGFFEDRKMQQLVHCLLAHHGKLEFGSPKVPMLREAIVLSYADDLDAKMGIVDNALADEASLDKDEFSPYNRFLETNIRKTN